MTNKKPIKEIRSGRLKASIWQNTSKTAKSKYKIKISRLYFSRDRDSNQPRWKYTTILDAQDLLPAAKLYQAIHAWLAPGEPNEQ